jgi:arsenate reductase-like glutaredoxin family protein
MGLQIFGTRTCPDTRKAERFFRDRGVAYQFIDLAEKGISAGELAAVAAALKAAGDAGGTVAGTGSGAAALIDTEGKRFRDRGLAYQDYDADAEILADPQLLKTPIVRHGRRAVIGHDPAGWKGMLEA